MKITALKLVNGMDIIGKLIEETDTEYKMEETVAIIIQQGQVPGQINLGFAPLAPLAEQTGRHMGLNLNLPKTSVLFPYIANQDVLGGYTEAVSGIAIARGSNISPIGRSPIKR